MEFQDNTVVPAEGISLFGATETSTVDAAASPVESLARSVMLDSDYGSLEANNPEVVNQIALDAMNIKTAAAKSALEAKVAAYSFENPVEIVSDIEKTVDLSPVSNPAMYVLRTQGRETYEAFNQATVEDRMDHLREVLSKKGEETGGFWSYTGSFFDLALTSLWDSITGGPQDRAAAWGLMASLAADTDVPIEEAVAQFTQKVEEMQDAGLLTDTNDFLTDSLIQNVSEYGHGPEALWDRAGQVLDITMGVVPAATAIKRAALGTTAISRIGQVGNPSTTAKAILTTLNTGTPNDIVELGALNAVTPSGASLPDKAMHHLFKMNTPTALNVARNIIADNSILSLMEKLHFGRAIDPQKYQDGYDNLVKEVRKTFSPENSVVDVGIIADNADNLIGWATFGSKGGGGFKTKAAAEKVAAKRFGTKDLDDFNVKIFKSDAGSGWFIGTTRRVATPDSMKQPAFNAADGVWNLFGQFGRRYLFSSGSSLTRELQGLASQGEMTYGRAIVTLEKYLVASRKGLTKDEIGRTESVFLKLRDGDLSYMKRNLDRDEFFKAYGPGATERQFQYYKDVTEVNNLAYYYAADGYLKEAVKEGYDTVIPYRHPTAGKTTPSLDEFRLVVRKAAGTKRKEGEQMLDLETGKLVSDLPKGYEMFRIREGFNMPGGGDTVVRYAVAKATRPKRMVLHQDVLGYNPGGVRNSSDRFVVGQIQRDKIAGSTTKAKNRVTVALSAYTRKEAKQAADEINNIFKDLRGRLKGASNMTRGQIIQDIKRLAKDQSIRQSLDDLVKANNNWNPEITDIDDLADWLENTVTLDIRNNIVFSEKNRTVDVLSKDGKKVSQVYRTKTWGDRLFELHNSPRDGVRRDKPIMGFGGKTDMYDNPVDAILQNVSRRVHERAYLAYETRTVQALLAAGKNHIKNYDDIKGMPPRAALREAKIVSTDPEAQRLADAIIAARRTMKIRDDTSPTIIENQMLWLQDFVYEKSGKRLNIASTNPVDQLRAITFDARLGFLAMDQIFIQASQVLQIAAIGIANPIGVAQDLALMIPMRALVSDVTHEATRKRIAAITGKTLGMDPKEVLEIADLLKKTGRLEISGSIGEVAEGAAMHQVMRNRLNKIRDGARFFFNEGEKGPRMYSGVMASREWKKLHPNISVEDPRAVAWIVDRMDKLTYQMNSVSASVWQRNILSVPLQFMTYSARVAEALASDVFTKGERARLLVGNMTMFGAAGVGMSEIYDTWLGDWTSGQDEGTRRLFKYGVWDYLTRISGMDSVTWSPRVAAAQGLYDMVDNVGEKSTAETAMGPSGQFIKNIFGDGFTLMSKILTGQFEHTPMAANKFMRNLSGYDKMYQAFMMYNANKLIARDYSVRAIEEDAGAAAVFGILAGGVNYDAQTAWDQVNHNQYRKGLIKTAANDVYQQYLIIQDFIDKGDMANAEEQGRVLALTLETLKESPGGANFVKDVFREADKKGKIMAQEVVLGSLKYGNNIGMPYSMTGEN